MLFAFLFFISLIWKYSKPSARDKGKAPERGNPPDGGDGSSDDDDRRPRNRRTSNDDDDDSRRPRNRRTSNDDDDDGRRPRNHQTSNDDDDDGEPARRPRNESIAGRITRDWQRRATKASYSDADRRNNINVIFHVH
jgi:hypothetical protein